MDLNPTCAYGELTIDETSMHEPRWHLPDLKEFIGNDVRGSDVLLPLIPGAAPNPRRFSPTRYLLPLYISGYVDEDGNCIAEYDEGYDPTRQLWTNINALKELVVGNGDGEGGSRAATFFTPDYETWTSWMHVLPLRTQQINDGLWVGEFEVILLYPWTVEVS